MRIKFLVPFRQWKPGEVAGRLDDGVAMEYLRRRIAVLADEVACERREPIRKKKTASATNS